MAPTSLPFAYSDDDADSSSAEWSIPASEVKFQGSPFNSGMLGTAYFYGTWLHSTVVLKRVKLNKVASFSRGPGVSSGRYTLSLFLREAAMWFRLHHPHVIKMYGACYVGVDKPFFVCEFASNGTLHDYVHDQGHHDQVWVLLHQAALGLQYLHERGIVHGFLKRHNLLVGSDGVTKLSTFALSSSLTGESDEAPPLTPGRPNWTVRWQGPELLREPQSATGTMESDVYALAMCILDAVSGDTPWSRRRPQEVRAAVLNGEMIPRPPVLNHRQWRLIERMTCLDPAERLTISEVVRELRDLANDADENQRNDYVDVQQYRIPGRNVLIVQVLDTLRTHIRREDGIDGRVYGRLRAVYDQMVSTSVTEENVKAYCRLLLQVKDALSASSKQSSVAQLVASRTHVAAAEQVLANLDKLAQELQLGGESVPDRDWSDAWKTDVVTQRKAFEASLSKASTVITNEGEAEEAWALLEFELKNRNSAYTSAELGAMTRALEQLSAEQLRDPVPEWFVPAHEVVFNSLDSFSRGSFASVHLGTWLGSSVVVKNLLPAADSAGFLREVGIWFRLTHPHVVKLFGACHVGNPFFVCEFASNGTLDEYLNSGERYNERWSKLLEAALGLEYLHQRGIVHGDLKCNNILVGSDGKTKLTDFGLSSIVQKRESTLGTQAVVGAWRWKAPECLAGQPTSFQADIYSFGMCVLEAVSGALPWGSDMPDVAVRFHVRRGRLPDRPAQFTDKEWAVVSGMCVFDPLERPTSSEIVQQLQKLAAESGNAP